jgi:hypothetical protein
MTRKSTIRFKAMSSEKVKTFLKKATFVINCLNASLFKKIACPQAFSKNA